MQADENGGDVRAIEALIARQCAGLDWAPGRSSDWSAFAADFLPAASLHPAACPARRQTVGASVERMRGLAATRLRSFHEAPLGTEIHVFGNVAVAAAACEMTENGAEVSRSVEMLLLVKDQGAWRIAGMGHR